MQVPRVWSWAGVTGGAQAWEKEVKTCQSDLGKEIWREVICPPPPPQIWGRSTVLIQLNKLVNCLGLSV